MVVVVVVLVGGGGGGDVADGSSSTSPSASAPSSAGSVPVGPAPQVAVAGTLERQGADLHAEVRVTNAGPETVWVPIGPGASSAPLLQPAAAGDGVVDLGYVVPPAPVGVEGVEPAFTFRPVAPGALLELESTDAPPPPDALVDPSGAPVEVTTYRLCVDAFAEASLPAGARRPVGDGPDVEVDAAAIEGEASRTCGPTLAA